MSAHIAFWVSLLAFVCLRSLFLYGLKKNHAAIYDEVAVHQVVGSNLDPRYWLFTRFIWSLRFAKLRDQYLTVVGILLIATEVIGTVSFLLVILH